MIEKESEEYERGWLDGFESRRDIDKNTSDRYLHCLKLLVELQMLIADQDPLPQCDCTKCTEASKKLEERPV